MADPARSPKSKLPFVIPLLALGTFLMCTTEFMIAGLLPQMAGDFGVRPSQVGLLITAFAIGMIVGAPVMAIATLRLPSGPPWFSRWRSSRRGTSSPRSAALSGSCSPRACSPLWSRARSGPWPPSLPRRRPVPPPAHAHWA
jgi:MFS family permease